MRLFTFVTALVIGLTLMGTEIAFACVCTQTLPMSGQVNVTIGQGSVTWGVVQTSQGQWVCEDHCDNIWTWDINLVQGSSDTTEFNVTNHYGNAQTVKATASSQALTTSWKVSTDGCSSWVAYSDGSGQLISSGSTIYFILTVVVPNNATTGSATVTVGITKS